MGGPDSTDTPTNGGSRRAAPPGNLGGRRWPAASDPQTPAVPEAPPKKGPPGFGHPSDPRRTRPATTPHAAATRDARQPSAPPTPRRPGKYRQPHDGGNEAFTQTRRAKRKRRKASRPATSHEGEDRTDSAREGGRRSPFLRCRRAKRAGRNHHQSRCNRRSGREEEENRPRRSPPIGQGTGTTRRPQLTAARGRPRRGRRVVDPCLHIYSPTTAGAESCAHTLPCPKVTEGGRF